MLGCLACGPLASSAQAAPTWLSPLDLSLAGQSASEPQVAVDPQGNAVAVWRRSNGANYIAQAASRAAGGFWQAPLDLSAASQNAGEPQVAVDPQGNAVAVWRRFNSANFIIQAASRPAGGSWQAPLDLSATGQNADEPQLAVDPQGNAVAVWGRYNGANYVVQGAGYDAAGPLLHELAMPATGTAGQPLSFSVSPLDVWSALGPSGWSFGDGGSASGTSVTHTFASAGSYQVTLTSADALGNTTSAAGTVTIAAPASPRRGRARAARLVRVRRDKALLRLTCGRTGPCHGVARLIALKGSKRILIGERAFRIPAGKVRVVRVKLRRKGKALVRKAGRRGLKARLTGRGVKRRTVVLKGAQPRRG